ncbi:unnamed protein product [Arabidopsis lyrata]|uniref:Uncharacterized protein n=1 Tax=Arabidopsis thaliana x Arabidopsis arenosa TaxID=1240361 RepID=A0A8T1Z0M7_9BRAS|nr:hypothetical protein ISN45_Aa06g028000 [Arabidopsis thaliana x Arabidopsis arenosa]CAH8279705.1 unnamed protein product [Arabidopsis lyrata]
MFARSSHLRPRLCQKQTQAWNGSDEKRRQLRMVFRIRTGLVTTSLCLVNLIF